MVQRVSGPAGSFPGTVERLEASVIAILQREGAAAVSARTVALHAEIPTSSIYHHFGDMDGLLARASQTACAGADAWCARQRDALTGMSGDPAAFAPVLAGLIDDWCEQQRPLAFAWREAQLLAMRDPERRAAADAWAAMWRAFWTPLCDRFGMGALAPAVMAMFDGESSLHLLRWRRPVDRAALSELCGVWGGWLDGRCGVAAPWRVMAQRAALEGQPPEPAWDETTRRIAAAAAATVAREGLAGLTHRAVAKEAETTLGVVSNRFRSSAELLRAAFESTYRRIVAPLDAGTAGLEGALPDEAALRASYELTLAASRDPAFRPFSAQLRYLRGRTSGRYLRAIVHPERSLSIADTALYSSIMSGRARAQLCGQGADDAAFEAMLAPLTRAPG